MTATIVDGKQIARDIAQELGRQVDAMSKPPRIDIFVCAPNGAIKSFVARKRRTAESIGVEFIRHDLPDTATTEDVQGEIDTIKDKTNGIVIQLPMPEHIDTETLLNNLPKNLDVDVLGDHTMQAFKDGEIQYEPPVAGAVREILERHNININDAKTVMIGKGKLVGMPTAIILSNMGANVFMIDKDTPKDIADAKILEADIVVSGTGVSNLVTPERVKEGVVLLDAGTSGNKATLAGDIDYACDEKATLFSRTPGGIGPITVAILFRNLLRSTTSD